MSRIGRRPIEVPGTVQIEIGDGNEVRVKGPKGELSGIFARSLSITRDDGTILVERPDNQRENRALHGLTRTLLNNMVVGVTDGYRRELEIQGVGYRAALRGTDIEFALGYSHPITVTAPPGIQFEVPVPTQVVVRGNDKQQVGQIAAEIRGLRPPEPYKGKGIRYAGEYVARKVGKRA